MPLFYRTSGTKNFFNKVQYEKRTPRNITYVYYGRGERVQYRFK